MCDLVDKEPTCFETLVQKREWVESMMDDVWGLVTKLEDKSVVSYKWIYEIKHTLIGIIEKYKAIFVVRGFSQSEGIDYEETFSPVERYTSIRTIMSLAAKTEWKLHQMDV